MHVDYKSRPLLQLHSSSYSPYLCVTYSKMHTTTIDLHSVSVVKVKNRQSFTFMMRYNFLVYSIVYLHN